jgi:DNA-binding PadR family transcriptional regulator
MARSNKSRFAVLGILTFRPMSGYDIRKVFGLGPGHFWRESYGQIYPILRALEGEGLVTRRTERGQAGRPARKVYTLTDKGRRALEDWLPEAPEAQPPRHELLLKLFFGRQAGPGVCAGHVRRQRGELEKQREAYRAIERHLREQCASDADAPYQLTTLRYGQHVTEALLAWCDETLRALERPGRAARGARAAGAKPGGRHPRAAAPAAKRRGRAG